MNENYGVINNDFARKVVHEYNAFMKKIRAEIEESRRATMLALKKLLKLKDEDIIEIREDDTFRIIPPEEVHDGR